MRCRPYLCLAGAVLIVALVPALALAYPEGGATGRSAREGTTTPVETCYCHQVTGTSYLYSPAGPHGSYTSTTVKCAMCHEVHTSFAAAYLLPRATITDTCFMCHDGSGGQGVYGTLAARGVSVAASHSIDATNVIPGGDPITGGDATRQFQGIGGNLGCDDCHSPHGSNVVAGFNGERKTSGSHGPWATSRLLKKRPTGATYDSADYGAGWCASCHLGRMASTTVHNHPVEATTTPGAYAVRRLPVVESETSTETTLGALGDPYGHRGFVMPDPRTPLQTGHNPICQQCHEDARTVGQPTTVTVPNYGLDGAATANGQPTNPRFNTFPHETANTAMLVEQDDSLCLNCHSAANLP